MGIGPKILKVLCSLILVLIVIAAVILGVFSFSEYRPSPSETLIASHETDPVFETGKTLTLISWNCGYGALGNQADFFMDGGSSVYTADKEKVLDNLNHIQETLRNLNPDLLVLQEVDIHSARSHFIDERQILREAMPDSFESFAYNFNTLYIPYPLPPIGHVESGLFTLSFAEPRQAERVSLPCPFSWPVRLFNLKRCLLVTRYPLLRSDKELVLINLHLEAYDDGTGKEEQTRMLREFMQAEYDQGNYVIAAGDFNQLFSNIDSSSYPVLTGTWLPGQIQSSAFDPDFTLLMDNSAPSCRSLDRKYEGADRSGFQFYLIDGFIVSHNVTVQSVETLDDDFLASDHNPVRLTFSVN